MPVVTPRQIELPRDDEQPRAICKNCNSPQMWHGYNYIRFIVHNSPDKYYGRIYGKHAFFFGTRARTHFRLILFGVASKCQKEGIGSQMLKDLVEYSRANGLQRITFRTSMFEPAVNFWESRDAKITAVKGNDYEMEIVV